MKDRIIRGTAKNGSIRYFSAVTTNLTEKSRTIHGLSPVSCAALGRMLTAASIMGIMLKNEGDKVSLQINGGGPAGPIIAVADCRGMVKGDIGNPYVDIPLKSDGKLDVGGAVGRDGRLVVIKDMGLKEPYMGQVPIVSGEIAEDLTYYFALSEQVASAVSLGVLIGRDCSVAAAGGFILQMMPDVEDYIRDIVEYRLNEIPASTKAINESGGMDAVIEELLDGMDPRMLEEYEVDYICDCSREKVERVLISMGRDELKKLADEKDTAEVCCHFCNKKYVFTRGELYNLMK